MNIEYNSDMNNKPNPELINEENPEWTQAMFSEAKTAAELFPYLFNTAEVKINPNKITKEKESCTLFK